MWARIEYSTDQILPLRKSSDCPSLLDQSRESVIGRVDGAVPNKAILWKCLPGLKSFLTQVTESDEVNCADTSTSNIPFATVGLRVNGPLIHRHRRFADHL